MKRPNSLQKGDHIAIVCTASAITGGIDKALDIFRAWELEVTVGETVSARDHTFAGEDSLRAQDLQQAINDPKIKAIFAARGGYGTVRIIDQVDFSPLLETPKWLIGFSDVTVLHSHIQRHYGMPTIHGQMPKTFEEASEISIGLLKDILFGAHESLTVSSINPHNVLGHAEGILVGGNLAILHSLVASTSEVDYTDKILFLEDVGEAYYTIDRMLWTLMRAGKLRNIKGLILGGFTSMKNTEPAFGLSLEQIIFEKIKSLDIPIVFDFPAGHIENNYPLILGAEISLSVGPQKTSITYKN